MQEQVGSVKAKSVIWLTVVLTAVLCGCAQKFPQSALFQQLDLRTLLLKNQEPGVPDFHSSLDISPEYALKDFDVLLNLTENQREVFLNNIVATFTNMVVQCDGKITGYGETSNLSEQNIRYETYRTVGQIRLYGSAVSESKSKIIVLVFECRK